MPSIKKRGENYGCRGGVKVEKEKQGGIALSFYLWYMVQEKDPNRVCKGAIAFALLCLCLLLLSIPEFRYKKRVLKSWLKSFEIILKNDIVTKEYQSRVSVFCLHSGLYANWYYIKAGVKGVSHLVRDKKLKLYFKNWPSWFKQYYCLLNRVQTQIEYDSITCLSATRNGELDNGIVDHCFKNEIEVVVTAPKLEESNLPKAYPRCGKLKPKIDSYLAATYLRKDSYSHLLTMSQLSCHFIAVPLREPNQERWGVLLLEIKEEGIPKEVLEDAKDKMILGAKMFQSLQNVI